MSITLKEALKLAELVANPHSLTPLYRTIELSAGKVRASSEFGSIEVDTTDQQLRESTLVEASALCAVVLSLDDEDALHLEVRDGALHWRAGSARGHLNLANCEHTMPQDVVPAQSIFGWVPPAGFEEAIQLAASACTSAAVAMGLYGVELLPDLVHQQVVLRSSNGIALAVATVKGGDWNGAPDRNYVLRPPVHSILAQLAAADEKAILIFDEKSVSVVAESFQACLPCAQPLEHDLGKIMAKYGSAEQVATIDRKGIKNFLVRARALTDRKQSVMVSLRVVEGSLILEHHGISSSAEEYFLAEGLDKDSTFDTITLPLDMLLAPLEHTDYVIFDYQKDKTLLLAGDAFDFLYILGGSKGK